MAILTSYYIVYPPHIRNYTQFVKMCDYRQLHTYSISSWLSKHAQTIQSDKCNKTFHISNFFICLKKLSINLYNKMLFSLFVFKLFPQIPVVEYAEFVVLFNSTLLNAKKHRYFQIFPTYLFLKISFNKALLNVVTKLSSK